MRKAVRHLSGVDSLNPHCWRGKRLCHHGDGVWKFVCAFCAVSQLVTCQSRFLYVKNVPQHNLKMRLKVFLFVPHWCAPQCHAVLAALVADVAVPPAVVAVPAAVVKAILSAPTTVAVVGAPTLVAKKVKASNESDPATFNKSAVGE
jgi:hypothetical protein